MKTMKIKQLGFTLIELMIVVAIIGLLATISVATYYDNIKKTMVTEGLMLHDSVKKGMQIYYLEFDRLPASMNSMMGVLHTGTYIKGNVDYQRGDYQNGVPVKVTICFKAFETGDDCIEWVWLDDPPGPTWSCKPSETNTTLQPKYLPKHCRD